MRRLSLVAVSVALLSVVPVLAQDERPRKPPVVPAPTADACADARGSVRQEAYGYTHVATLRNGCTRPVECALWTDVDPEPRTKVSAKAGESVEIITRRGSPAREVTAFKSCRFK